MMTKRQTSVAMLLLGSALLVWWFVRRNRASGGQSDFLSQAKDIVGAFKPGAPTIIERSPIDAATEGLFSFKALYDRYGDPYRAYVNTAEGGWLYQQDMSLLGDRSAGTTTPSGFQGTNPLRTIEP